MWVKCFKKIRFCWLNSLIIGFPDLSDGTFWDRRYARIGLTWDWLVPRVWGQVLKTVFLTCLWCDSPVEWKKNEMNQLSSGEGPSMPPQFKIFFPDSIHPSSNHLSWSLSQVSMEPIPHNIGHKTGTHCKWDVSPPEGTWTGTQSHNHIPPRICTKKWQWDPCICCFNNRSFSCPWFIMVWKKENSRNKQFELSLKLHAKWVQAETRWLRQPSSVQYTTHLPLSPYPPELSTRMTPVFSLIVFVAALSQCMLQKCVKSMIYYCTVIPWYNTFFHCLSTSEN